MFNFLSDNTAIVTLLVLTLLVLLLLGVVIWAAMKGAQQSDLPAAAKPRLLSADSLKQSFRVAVELIESNLAVRSERYNLSWTLVLNEGKHGRELPLVQSGLQSALSADSTLTASGQGISWNFFDQGVAIQLQSDYLGSPDPEAASANSTWDDFLGLCRSYRPDRPFDAIVLAIPAAAFLDVDGQAHVELIAKAKAIHRRLWLAQNRLALRFPIYIAIADCETIPGFSRFAAALPEPLRRSMLGWSSAYELSAPFQGQWVDIAMNEMVRSLADTGAELCALEPAGSDSSAYFLLPTQVERLRAGLKMFAEELMRPSAYHEPFLLRGIYLTGDCGDAAVLLSETASAADPGEQAEFALVGFNAPAGEMPAESKDEAGALGLPAMLPGQANAVPAFLRDIFERKIFAEAGLVRSASSQRMRRPAMTRVLRWSALGLATVWLIGMGAASFRLHYMSREMVDHLHRLDADAGRSADAGSRSVIDPAESRQRALDALLNIEQMGSAHLSAFFMPGSWPWFDSLHERLQQRMENGFAENAFDPLRRASYARVSELTGVPVDPVTGSLIIGAQCTLPAGWQQLAGSATNALNVEDLPEFAATLQYVARLEQLEKMLQAMMRLKSPRSGPASGDDLALVVRMALGAELNGNPARTAALFRQVAQNMSSLTMEPLQEAAACSLRLAVRRTTQRLFADNGLLKAEQAISAASVELFDTGPRAADPAATLLVWQNLRNALRSQEAHLAPGKGAWMHSTTLALGPAWDNLLQRIEALSLLGKGPADETRKQADQGFIQFTSQWDATMASDQLVQGLNSGLEWSDTSRSWNFAADRRALLDVLTSLLSQPYMKFNTQIRFPDVPTGATVSWDQARLEQVLALAEARRRFQVELLPKFPASLHSASAAFVDAGLLETARDLLSQAYFVSSREVQAPASDIDRGRALRVRAWLQDMGAPDTAEALSRVLSTDALSRLQLLDDTLSRAQVYVPRDRAFRSWNGEKGPLLHAFGASDAAGLNAYISQQQSFIEAINKDAEALLLQLGGAQSGNPLVARWQASVSDLSRYRLKSPTSSLMALEQFVLNGAAELDVGNCLDVLSARAFSRRGGDLYAERLQALQAGLQARCRELSASRYQEAWNTFADTFNRELAGRAPFRAPAVEVGTRGVAAERVLAADVDEVGKVLKLFDRAHAQTVAAERDTARPAMAGSLRKVDEQMQRVRDFLSPLYQGEEGQTGGLDVSVEFRANTTAEIDGNKIIDWSLGIGGQTLRQRDTPRPLRWEPGMPVTLTLRVAQDGPVIPKAEAGHPGMSVEERTVSYRFTDPWSLLSFAGAYRDNDAAASAARSQLLRFEFPMTAVGDGARIGTRDTRARVYVRLSVSAPGKRAPLAWPSVFPARIPTW
ncbi:type VI secretion system protein [Janthinobacterium aquaticum]|uniref:type VI secretion system protein n=1 Tax=Janthinobacterium sp. FT58W TaxID=2654254 RepID=UPI001D016414|nr:type VI secretion system protein [Janthinobacterium sp. FT58W]